ncbi:MAG: hypothetical protein OXS29_04960 [bacterium]|nr:hypothetical protein [bacterium]MDE0288580.1 hypothetical protein [bacterium]MDE0437731.1 hypothetical protein [bacterium]
MTAGDHLVDVLVDAYAAYVRAAVGQRIGREPAGLDEALGEGRRWLQDALECLLGRPYPLQDRGPLELFQEAMRFPTAVLQAEGYPPVPRDDLTRSALPGDLYDLAPASSRDLGEEVWRAHLAWGATKAAAMTGRTV